MATALSTRINSLSTSSSSNTSGRVSNSSLTPFSFALTSSPLPLATLPLQPLLSRGAPERDVDTKPSPLCENTQGPATVKKRSVHSNIATCQPTPCKTQLKSGRQIPIKSNSMTLPTAVTAGSTSLALRQAQVSAVDGHNREVTIEGDKCNMFVDQTKCDWVLNLRRCLLEAEAEIEKLRNTVKLHEKEAFVVSEEIASLRRVNIMQEKRIAELEERLAQEHFLTTSDTANGTIERGANTVAPSLENVAFIEGLSVDDIRRAVHCAVDALQRIEVEFEAEKRCRYALEKKIMSLRRQLFLTQRGEGKVHDDCTNSCGEETHDLLTAFVQGPLQRFLTESEELRSNMEKPFAGHAAAHF